MSDCAWDAEGEECSAKQADLLAALLGSPIVAGAKACHANRSPEACAKAGPVEFDPALAAALLTPAGGKAP
jgi:hypothetical protein